ncbi:MAG: SirB2 family protein [Betaproteobacteria bacterium]|nr:SirB2 family protein [Betaproteobacteria bacterium]
MGYLEVKALHVACVAASYGLFVLRGLWMMRRPALLLQRWVRVVPHVIDTVLLASAAVLAYLSHQYPGVDPWLTAKVVGLLGYIGLGAVALKRGKTRRVRITAWVAAQAVFAYIVLVAVTRSPLVL